MSSSFQILCGPFFFIKLRTICCFSFLSLILLCRRKAGRPPSLSFSYKFYHQHFDFLKLASRDKKRKFFLCSLLHLSVCMSCLSTLCSFVLFLSFCSCNFLNFLSVAMRPKRLAKKASKKSKTLNVRIISTGLFVVDIPVRPSNATNSVTRLPN